MLSLSVCLAAILMILFTSPLPLIFSPPQGEVLPTAGGGAQVVLRDVEILHQRDPLHHVSTTPNRKRSSTEHTPSLQERCGWGVQGGGSDGGTPRYHQSENTKRPRM